MKMREKEKKTSFHISPKSNQAVYAEKKNDNTMNIRSEYVVLEVGAVL